MDSLTQIVLGASVGEFILGKKVGNKAALWGAVAGTIPDLDVFAAFFLNPAQAILFHRGFMHSILFSVLFAPIMGYLLYLLYKKKWSIADWTKLSFWGLLTHPILDCFTTWGTQLFWPFEYRVTFNSVFVIDLHYTLPFMVLLIIALRKPRESKIRRQLNNWGLRISTAYLLIGLLIHSIVVIKIQEKFETKFNTIQIKSVQVKPMPFSTLYWEGFIETDDSFYNCYYSVMTGHKDELDRFIPKNHDLATEYGFEGTIEFETLKKISNGYYVLEPTEKGINFCDMRFGCTDGISNRSGKEIIFKYHLYKTENGIQFENKRSGIKNMWQVLGDYVPKIWGF